jgi:diguanylate cyclase (GGDEF)-like protein
MERGVQDPQLAIVTAVRPGPVHVIAAGLVGLLLLSCGFLLPMGPSSAPGNPSFLAAYGMMTLVIDLIIAVLLLGQARLADDRATQRLGSAYLFAALIVVPQMAAFPNVISDEPLLGGPGSAEWLWVFWHGGFAALIAWYAAVPPGRPGALWLSPRIAAVVAAVVGFAVLASRGLPLLPDLAPNGDRDPFDTLGIGPIVLAVNLLALALVVARLRTVTVVGLWLAVAMLAACVDVGMTLMVPHGFLLGWYCGRVASLLTGVSVLGALLFEFLYLYGRINETNRYLDRLATSDGLTGIANRRSFDETLDAEWLRANRDGTELSLLMLDVDWFKGFNDRYGHRAGDDCLRAVAAAMRGALLRPADFAARYGGEEFVVLLAGTDAAGAATIAERVRDTVEATAVPHERSIFGHVTVSIGAATACPRTGSRPQDLIDAADQALYRAKAAGRNRVLVGAAAPEADRVIAQLSAADD